MWFPRLVPLTYLPSLLLQARRWRWLNLQDAHYYGLQWLPQVRPLTGSSSCSWGRGTWPWRPTGQGLLRTTWFKESQQGLSPFTGASWSVGKGCAHEDAACTLSVFFYHIWSMLTDTVNLIRHWIQPLHQLLGKHDQWDHHENVGNFWWDGNILGTVLAWVHVGGTGYGLEWRAVCCWYLLTQVPVWSIH